MKVLISIFFLLCVLSGCQWGTSPTAKDKWIEVKPPVIEDFTIEKMGHDAALKDIEEGKLHLKLRFKGRPDTNAIGFAQIFSERYSVDVSITSQVKAVRTDYVDAYNRAMREAVTRRYGDDVFEKVLREVSEHRGVKLEVCPQPFCLKEDRRKAN